MACDSPFYVLPKAGTDKVPVPCGRCPICLKRRVDNWVFRLLEESKRQTHSHFVTLTYDTRHVPISEHGFMTLQPDDLKNYWKRLRKLCPDAQLKYYACGEYGTQNKRPHYHAIVFGVSDPQRFYDAWGVGEVHVGNVTGDAIAYTAKYVQKSRWQRMHERDDRVPEFSRMSKGLGENYITPEMTAYHKADLTRNYVTRVGGHRTALPRYYRDKIYSEAELLSQRKIIIASLETEEQKEREAFERIGYTDYDFETYKTSRKYGRYKSFHRSLRERKL